VLGQFHDHAAKSERGPGLCASSDLDLEKTCKKATDCSIVEEVLDGCATTALIGVNTQGRAQFAARPKIDWCAPNPCPNCVVRWVFTEDCSTDRNHAVECVHGRCMTRSTP
jgi:hypothetical protein